LQERIPSNTLADTGTTLLLLPDDIVNAYYEAIPGAKNDKNQGGYVFACDGTVPDLTITINGYDAVIPGAYINFAPLGDGSNNCFGGLQSSSGISTSIFGDVFLKSQYVVFDSNGPRLGFAPQAEIV
jgi:aspergillopepsin I